MPVSQLLSMAQLVLVLEWSSVTIFYKDTGVLDTRFLSILHESGVTTQLISWATWASSNSTDISNSCLPSGPASFIVIGQPAFVLKVFQKVVNCKKDTYHENKLFNTEWLTVLPEENLADLQSVARPLENCAIISSYNETNAMSLWTIRHMKNISKIMFMTSLPPKIRLGRRHIFPNQYQGLGGRTLRAVVKTWDFVLSSKKVNGTTVYQGLVMDIFRELADSLNFSYTLMPPVDDSWGQELDNGQWDGPIGMLTRKEADIAVGFYTITPQRSVVVDPTTPYLYDNAAIVFRKTQTNNYFAFFTQPFQKHVYAVVGGSFVLVLLLLLLLEKCHHSMNNDRNMLSATKSSWLWLASDIEILLAGLVGRSSEQESASRAGRVLVMTWFLLGMILTSAYSSQLTSSLTVSNQELPFNSLAELVDQDVYKFGVAAGTAQFSLLKNSTVSDYRRFYHSVLELAKEDPDVMSSDIEVHKVKVMHENYASLQGSMLLSSGWSSESCGQLTFLPEKLRTASFGFYLQKGSPYTRIVSEQMGLMVDSGLVSKWKQWSLPENRECQRQEEQSGRVIGLPDTHTAFLMAAVGLGLALAALLGERLILVLSGRHR